MQALGGVIGRLRTLSYDFEHQRCDARHIHVELQEIIAELEGIRPHSPIWRRTEDACRDHDRTERKGAIGPPLNPAQGSLLGQRDRHDVPIQEIGNGYRVAV